MIIQYALSKMLWAQVKSSDKVNFTVTSRKTINSKKTCSTYLKRDNITLICGSYEGIDERESVTI